ncbi:hypothetical protein D3C76_1300880 [compost metagenome]
MQDLQHALLGLEGDVVGQGDAQAVFDIPSGLAQARAEVVVAGGVDPWVMGRPGIESRLMDLRREQFGQRAAGRLLPAGTAGEIDVGIHGETHAGQHQFLREDLLAVEPHRLAQA